MKYISIVFFLLAARLSAQVDTLVVTQDHFSSKKVCKGSKCKYWVDNRRVSKEEFDKHLNEPNIGTCKPCYLIQLDKKKNQMFEGDFYTDCCIGVYILRYSNGKIKVKGQYNVPTKDLLEKDIFKLGYCRPDGEWTYYKENGDIEKKETYKNGELVK